MENMESKNVGKVVEILLLLEMSIQCVKKFSVKNEKWVCSKLKKNCVLKILVLNNFSVKNNRVKKI